MNNNVPSEKRAIIYSQDMLNIFNNSSIFLVQNVMTFFSQNNDSMFYVNLYKIFHAHTHTHTHTHTHI